jgi:hypothetical protein
MCKKMIRLFCSRPVCSSKMKFLAMLHFARNDRLIALKGLSAGGRPLASPLHSLINESLSFRTEQSGMRNLSYFTIFASSLPALPL